MSLGTFQMYLLNGFTNQMYLTYMYKQGVALNDQQLPTICPKTQTDQTKPKIFIVEYSPIPLKSFIMFNII